MNNSSGMAPINHRTRVGAERRARMRQRLIASALGVFASKGFEAADVEDVIEAAEVSRGTFYNYFRTSEELMQAVLEAVGNDLLAVIDAVVLAKADPAERLAAGLRMVLHTARGHALLAHFVNRVGVERTLRNSVAAQYLMRDLEAGIREQRFALESPVVGLVVVLGTMQAAIMALSQGTPVDDTFCEEITYRILLALGMNRPSARRLVGVPLEEVPMPDESLLARTSGVFPPAQADRH